MKGRKGGFAFALHLGKVEAGEGGEMIRICLTVCPTLEPKHEADQGGLKMNFWGIPGSKYDFVRNASNFFYSKPLT